MKALLLIDIQNDYFPGGKMELEGSEDAGQIAGGLLAAFREYGLPVFDAGFFLSNTEGSLIHRSVEPLAEEPVVIKHLPNSFRETTLLGQLRERNISGLVVAGMMTHMCVDTTVRAACDARRGGSKTSAVRTHRSATCPEASGSVWMMRKRPGIAYWSHAVIRSSWNRTSGSSACWAAWAA